MLSLSVKFKKKLNSLLDALENISNFKFDNLINSHLYIKINKYEAWCGTVVGRSHYNVF